MKAGIRTPPLNLIFYDYFQNNILISGVTNSKPTSVLIFMYDTEESELKEFMTRSEIPDMGGISKLSRIEDVEAKIGKSLESKDLLLQMNRCIGVVGVSDTWDFIWVRYMC